MPFRDLSLLQPSETQTAMFANRLVFRQFRALKLDGAGGLAEESFNFGDRE
jgi:hypothetical protein